MDTAAYCKITSDAGGSSTTTEVMHVKNRICALVLTLLMGSCFMLARAGQRSSAASGSTPQPAGDRPGQLRRKEPCFVSGIVLNTISGEPVKRAQLNLGDANVNAAASRMETDATGRFLLRGVAQGHHRLIIRKRGFLDAEFDIPCCNQQSDIAFIDNSPQVTLRLVPLSVIAGRVIHQEGEPV